MTSVSNQKILDEFEFFFTDKIISSHIKNTKKLQVPNNDEININPLLAPYLSAYLTGEVTAKGVAKALVLARVIATSITTSFGSRLQRFISDHISPAFPSMVSGMDVEFIDQVDGRRKWAQLKLGVSTINKPDVKTIDDDFQAARRLAQQNGKQIGISDFVIGVMTGEDSRLSANYKTLRDRHNYPVFVGSNFWLRLTGEADFYERLVKVLKDCIAKVDESALVEDTINIVANRDDVKQLVDELTN
jgi:hypothetical protein